MLNSTEVYDRISNVINDLKLKWLLKWSWLNNTWKILVNEFWLKCIKSWLPKTTIDKTRFNSFEWISVELDSELHLIVNQYFWFKYYTKEHCLIIIIPNKETMDNTRIIIMTDDIINSLKYKS